jgi:hypothetical protein
MRLCWFTRLAKTWAAQYDIRTFIDVSLSSA